LLQREYIEAGPRTARSSLRRAIPMLIDLTSCVESLPELAVNTKRGLAATRSIIAPVVRAQRLVKRSIDLDGIKKFREIGAYVIPSRRAEGQRGRLSRGIF